MRARIRRAAVGALMLTVLASCVSIAFDINRLSVLNHLLSDAASDNVLRLPSDLAAAGTSDHQTSIIAAGLAIALARTLTKRQGQRARADQSGS